MDFHITDPWKKIPDGRLHGLSLGGLREFLPGPLAMAHAVARCWNCRRLVKIQATGACSACYCVTKGKKGNLLLDALREARKRLMPAQAHKTVGVEPPPKTKRPAPSLADRCLIPGIEGVKVSSFQAQYNLCAGRRESRHGFRDCKTCKCGKDIVTGRRLELPVNHGGLMT